MKKLFALALGLFIVITLAAQDEQANNGRSKNSPSMWLGGEAVFGNLSAREFTFGPSFGILINDRMGVGGTVIFSGGNNSNEWGVMPYFRYYIPVADQFSFYGDAFIGIGGGDVSTDIDGGEYNTFDFGARLGLQYWFTSRWSVTASNNVLIYESTDGDGEFGAGISFNSVNFSLFFHF